MLRIAVSSSNIVSIGYDEPSEVLEIEFREGKIYQYSGVPKAIYDALMSAASHGTYFHSHINGKFPTSKL